MRICMPSLNLQFLSLNDYLIRNYNLLKLETGYQIRSDLEECIKRMEPEFNQETNQLVDFKGWSRNAIMLNSFTIHEIAPPLLGELQSKRVLAEITYDSITMQTYIKKEWDMLQQGDILYIISFFNSTPQLNHDRNQDQHLN